MLGIATDGPKPEPIAPEPDVPLPVPDSPEFARLVGGDDGADLERIALEIARDAHPGLDFGPSLARLDGLADRARPRIPDGSGTEDVLRQINWVLYVEEGFSGNDEDYDDPNNSYLDEVLGRRTGIPISLAVVYRAVAGRLGLPMWGVNLPAHFVLGAARGDGSTVFVDAFHGGALIDRDGCRRLVASRAGAAVELAEEHIPPATTAEVVTRMLRNLGAIHMRSGDAASALPALTRLAALAPDVPGPRRDLGLASLMLDRLPDAIGHLSAYLEQASQPTDAAEIRSLLLQARQGLDGGR